MKGRVGRAELCLERTFGERKGRQLEERVVRSKLGLEGLFGEREGILLTGRVGKSELGFGEGLVIGKECCWKGELVSQN